MAGYTGRTPAHPTPSTDNLPRERKRDSGQPQCLSSLSGRRALASGGVTQPGAPRVPQALRRCCRERPPDERGPLCLCSRPPRALSGISRPLSLRLVLTTTSGQPALRTTVFSCCVSHGRHLAAVRGTRQPARGSARVSGTSAACLPFLISPPSLPSGKRGSFSLFISL